VAPVAEDSVVTIMMGEDRLIAFGSFAPARSGGQQLTEEYVASVLEQEGISIGVDWPRIREAIETCNVEARPLAGVPVAFGRPPVQVNPEHFQIEPRFLHVHEHLTAAANGRVDHRTRHYFNIVRKGETIAHLEPEMRGIDGVDLTGELIPHGTLERKIRQNGKNTALHEGVVTATCGGMLLTDENTFWVEETLKLDKDVDYGVGNLSFPGNVLLGGGIKDGFRLWIGGSVAAKNTLDVHELFCRKDLTAAAGIIGRGAALVRAGGRVKSKFIEHCQLESKSSVYIQTEVFNSRVYTLDRLATGDKGRIIGGEVRSAHGVTANQIGNEAEVQTTIVTGIDFIVQRRIERIKARHQELTLMLQKLDERLRERPTSALLERRARLYDATYKYSVQMSTLITRLDRNEHAEVVARTRVYPGVVVEICRASFAVKEVLGPTRFHLDKAGGRVVCEPLDKSAST